MYFCKNEWFFFAWCKYIIFPCGYLIIRECKLTCCHIFETSKAVSIINARLVQRCSQQSTIWFGVCFDRYVIKYKRLDQQIFHNLFLWCWNIFTIGSPKFWGMKWVNPWKHSIKGVDLRRVFYQGCHVIHTKSFV